MKINFSYKLLATKGSYVRALQGLKITYIDVSQFLFWGFLNSVVSSAATSSFLENITRPDSC